MTITMKNVFIAGALAFGVALTSVSVAVAGGCGSSEPHTHAKETAVKTVAEGETAEKLTKQHLIIALEAEKWKSAEKVAMKALAEKEGIKSVTPLEKMSAVRVAFNPEEVSRDKVLEMVQAEGGDKVKASIPQLRVTTVPVKGMTCTGCSDKVTKHLAKVDDVALTIVDLEGNKAHVLTIKENIGSDKLKAAIEEAGFKMEETEAAEEDETTGA